MNSTVALAARPAAAGLSSIAKGAEQLVHVVSRLQAQQEQLTSSSSRCAALEAENAVLLGALGDLQQAASSSSGRPQSASHYRTGSLPSRPSSARLLTPRAKETIDDAASASQHETQREQCLDEAERELQKMRVHLRNDEERLSEAELRIEAASARVKASEGARYRAEAATKAAFRSAAAAERRADGAQTQLQALQQELDRKEKSLREMRSAMANLVERSADNEEAGTRVADMHVLHRSLAEVDEMRDLVREDAEAMQAAGVLVDAKALKLEIRGARPSSAPSPGTAFRLQQQVKETQQRLQAAQQALADKHSECQLLSQELQTVQGRLGSNLKQ
ncbi:hypothetical protein WJX72_006971 [[Myrmecia] bisecta]|uniref:Uncharacterized protein n=1 Tax=[Myrmecia] bisecta TaxID=41462 RepID=A0AAW1PC06_9CHLO